MPRDGSGVYHRPVGTDAVTDTTIESTKYNLNVADVEQDLNQPRPIMAGGTGATSADGVLDNISAEKFKQVVTNWDSAPWRAGSFYAATTATGTAPVASHAFAGIAYYANATDFVLEATDLTDVSDPTVVNQYIRVMTASVWGPWTRKTAVLPIPGSLGDYTFDSGITFPPGSGQVRFNNATQNSTTEVFISHITVTGIDNSGVIPFALKSGYDFYVQDKDEPAKWKMFTATANPVLSGSDFRVTAVFKSGGTDVVSGQRMLFGANSGASASTYAVRYDAAQTLTAPQQAQARVNIAALGVVRIQKFTASGTYTPNANMVCCVVECVGGGGGGGASGVAINTTTLGAGGSGGGYSASVLTAATVGASKAVVIGAGGSGVFNAAGTAGGNTTFGSTLVVANGGPLGTYNVFSVTNTVVAAAGTGDIALPGDGSGPAGGDTSAAMTIGIGARGGNSRFGTGGPGGNASGNQVSGFSASGYGSGGGGGASNKINAASAGGFGAAGICIVTEYCTQ